MYIATTYIGGAYIPGDVIPDDVPAEKLAWLIKAGAVREAAPPATDDSAESVDIPQDDTPAEMPGESMDDSEDVFDDEADAPEIDVMAGIVKESENPELEKKPRATSKKKAPKGGKTK